MRIHTVLDRAVDDTKTVHACAELAGGVHGVIHGRTSRDDEERAANIACQHPRAASSPIALPYFLFDQSRAASSIALVGSCGDSCDGVDGEGPPQIPSMQFAASHDISGCAAVRNSSLCLAVKIICALLS